MPPAMAWEAAGPAFAALGFTKLDAETYWGGLDRRMYVSLELRDGRVSGWVERPWPGGALEQFMGEGAELRPGEQGRSELARFVAGVVREGLCALPHAARLTVKAPEMPGDEYKLRLSTPLSSPDHAAVVARVLLALDEAAQRPAPAEGALQARLPPVVTCWQAAGPSLEAAGMKKLDAETYWGGMENRLFLNVDVRAASVSAWVERPSPGGMLDQFVGQDAALAPGDATAPARSELARFVAGVVWQALGALPRQARLTVKAPEIPGASYALRLSTPFSSPDQASTVARVLLALDEVARTPAR
jgi:hypothetical protein